MPTVPRQPGDPRPHVLVVSDGVLVRHRLQRRLARAGAEVPRAIDPWHAAAEIARSDWDVVVWAAPRHEALARELLAGPDPVAILLVMAGGAPAARAVAALEVGFADVVREDAAPAEIVARALAAARRAGRLRAVLDAAEAFRELVEGSRDILARHAPDGTMLYASGAAWEILGHDPRLLRGARALDLWHPDDRETVARALEGDPRAVGPHLHRARRRDGGWVWMETTVRALHDGSGRLVETHTDSRDVSERMRSEAERAALGRVTAAVAGGADLAAVAALVAREAADLTGLESASVVRFQGDEGLAVGAVGPALRTGHRVPLGSLSPGDVVVPVVVGGRPWGMVLARGTGDTAPVRPECVRPLGDLVALAVNNARARERLVSLATTDPLTGLSNRRTFHARLGEEAARARRSERALSLVMVDLDHFKAVNDTHGHQAGDEVLREVARRLMAVSREGDVVARFGGEELAWLLPEAEAGAALAAAERLRRRIGDAAVPGVGRVTASLGVAELDDAGPDDLVRRADLALYRAKESGRDACVAWSPDARVMGARSA